MINHLPADDYDEGSGDKGQKEVGGGEGGKEGSCDCHLLFPGFSDLPAKPYCGKRLEYARAARAGA